MCKKALCSVAGVKNGVKGESGASDDELNSDVVSHYSSASESASVAEEGPGSSTHPPPLPCLKTSVGNPGLFTRVASDRGGAGGRADRPGGNRRQAQAVHRQPDG